MPIIDAQYTMTDTARELEARVKDEHIAYLKERQRATDAERRAEKALGLARFWYRLCIVLLIAAGVLCAFLALAT